jgi:hypothetical protein
MKLRQALIEQGPSLALQRSAQIEISRLDSVLLSAINLIEVYDSHLANDYPLSSLESPIEKLYNSINEFQKGTAG